MERLQISGYKSIKNLDLKLEPINILIGANGSGKSNLLSFFEFLKNIYRENLREYVALRGNTDKFLHKGIKITTEITAKLYFPPNDYAFTLKKGAEDAFIFVKEGLGYEYHNLGFEKEVDIASYNTESNLRQETRKRASYIKEYLHKLQKYHFHDTGTNSPFNKTSNIKTDKYFLYDKGDNIAAYLYYLEQNHLISYRFIIKTIQSIAPYFLDFVLKPDENGFITLLWENKNSDTIYGVSDLSDGTIRFMALCTLFLQPNLPETIIIDEPELGLHPAAIAKLAGLIQSAAAKRCQVIIATQSTDLISYFEPKDIVTVDDKQGESIYTRLNSEDLAQWLEEYTIDDLWKRSIITTGQPNY
jgi:predicted ATPase